MRGRIEKVLAAVREQLRVAEGRNPEPSAGLVDSQTVEGADTVGRDSRCYDAGKKINGRKRFIVPNTLGLLLTIVVCAAMQDRDGGQPPASCAPRSTSFASPGKASRSWDCCTRR
ncbi:hypothetical protein KDL28_39405 [Pseudonocardia sp. S2-4]|uniref:Transposase IS4-like domain-containing protein n=1 Tax=Pseudonocardia humida TaxID=2800819 RepID=A0ABT1ADX0_9PSEU|nr:hypothetical protein [Pseudonocardia humida]